MAGFLLVLVGLIWLVVGFVHLNEAGIGLGCSLVLLGFAFLWLHALHEKLERLERFCRREARSEREAPKAGFQWWR